VEGVTSLLELWCACVKYAVRIDARFAGVTEVSELEETVSAGVFTGVMEPLLKSSAPLYLRAAAAVMNASQGARGAEEGGEGGISNEETVRIRVEP